MCKKSQEHFLSLSTDFEMIEKLIQDSLVSFESNQEQSFHKNIELLKILASYGIELQNFEANLKAKSPKKSGITSKKNNLAQENSQNQKEENSKWEIEEHHQSEDAMWSSRSTSELNKLLSKNGNNVSPKLSTQKIFACP